MFYLNKDPFFGNFNSVINGLTGTLKTDVIDGVDSYLVMTDVPGVNKEDVTISYEDEMLTITVNHEDDKDSSNYTVKERGFSNASRSFYLENGNPEDIKAKLENGVLTITIGKMPKVETKKVIVID